MRFLLVSKDQEVVDVAREGFHPSDDFLHYAHWTQALEHCDGVDLMFVDLVATLIVPHKIQGYADFAQAKMNHPIASRIPLVVISPEATYDLDYFIGWPNFVFANLQRPVTYKHLRRASTWV